MNAKDIEVLKLLKDNDTTLCGMFGDDVKHALSATLELIDRWPKTADDVPIYPGMTCYLMTDRTDGKHWMMTLRASDIHSNTQFCWFSTPEAAQAAFYAKYPHLKPAGIA